MTPCLKQQTRCVIVRADGRRYEASNTCDVDHLAVCPRVAAGCPTGTGYELCGSVHAEVNAARLAAESADVPGEAFLYGHTWLCGPCQHALTAVNVRTFHIPRTPTGPRNFDERGTLPNRRDPRDRSLGSGSDVQSSGWGA